MPKYFTSQLYTAYQALKPILIEAKNAHGVLQNDHRSFAPKFFARRSKHLQKRIVDLNRFMGILIDLLHEQRVS
jgi:hypothetical protein